jgi:hypothetical protein
MMVIGLLGNVYAPAVETPATKPMTARRLRVFNMVSAPDGLLPSWQAGYFLSLA